LAEVENPEKENGCAVEDEAVAGEKPNADVLPPEEAAVGRLGVGEEEVNENMGVASDEEDVWVAGDGMVGGLEELTLGGEGSVDDDDDDDDDEAELCTEGDDDGEEDCAVAAGLLPEVGVAAGAESFTAPRALRRTRMVRRMQNGPES